MTPQAGGIVIALLIILALTGALASCVIETSGWHSADPGLYRGAPDNGAWPG